MTAGHLIKNYFELFYLKIGINDRNVEFWILFLTNPVLLIAMGCSQISQVEYINSFFGL